MSLNTAHLNGGVLIHSGEQIILFSDNVNMEWSGQSDQAFQGTKHGSIYLTTHRVIFNSKNQSDAMQSFSLPFITMNEVEIEQPIFGANFIKGKVRAQPNGNWIGDAKFKLTFKHGGAIDFGQAMLKAAHLALRSDISGDSTQGGYRQPPPPYMPPQTQYYAAPPPAYAPPPQGYYGWAPPTNTFPQQPPANGVFMTDAPPPYPGIQTQQNYGQGPPPPMGGGVPPQGYAAQPGAFGFAPPSAPQSAQTKAEEAAQSAYYDPSRPQMAYVPPPAYYESPPTYDQATHKKDQ